MGEVTDLMSQIQRAQAQLQQASMILQGQLLDTSVEEDEDEEDEEMTEQEDSDDDDLVCVICRSGVGNTRSFYNMRAEGRWAGLAPGARIVCTLCHTDEMGEVDSDMTQSDEPGPALARVSFCEACDRQLPGVVWFLEPFQNPSDNRRLYSVCPTCRNRLGLRGAP